jgi:hypothetical protein
MATLNRVTVRARLAVATAHKYQHLAVLGGVGGHQHGNTAVYPLLQHHRRFVSNGSHSSYRNTGLPANLVGNSIASSSLHVIPLRYTAGCCAADEALSFCRVL